MKKQNYFLQSSKGLMSIKNLMCAFLLLLIFGNVNAQTVIQVGTGTVAPTVSTNPGSGANGASPYGVNVSSGSGGKKLQIIYTAAQINAALAAASLTTGVPYVISTTSWDVSSSVGASASKNQSGTTIKMANVAQTSFVSAATPYTGASTTVFGPTAITYPAGTGYLVTNTLASTFTWDGTSSLLVEYCYTFSGVGVITTYGACRRTATASNQMIYNGGAAINCATSTYATAVAAISNVKLTVTSACTQPTVLATAMNFSSLTTSSVQVNWTNGNGASRVVVAHATTAVSAGPATGTDYSAGANSDFTLGQNLGSGNIVVYAGTGSSVNVTGLTGGTTYFFSVYEASATFCYSAGLSGSQAIPLCAPPTVPASGQSSSNITTTQADINWTANGDGNGGVVVFLKAGSAITTDPTQTTAYTANAAFGTGSQIGATGAYAVYSGNGSSVTVTGLTTNITYYYSIYAFHSSTNCYASAASGSFTTANSPMTTSAQVVTQVSVATVSPGSTNNQIIKLEMVCGTGTAPALVMGQLFFTTAATNGGTTNPADIANAKVYYTGTTNTFSTTTQYGSTVVSPNGAFIVSGSTTLVPGSNYFWLTYDIISSPTIGDFVDAKLSTIDVGAIITPSGDPAGNRQINPAAPCVPTFGGTACSTPPYIDFGMRSGLFSGASFCSGLGCSGFYTDYYSTFTATLNQSQSYALTVNYNNSSSLVSFSIFYHAWVDWNNDGVFSEPSERIMQTNVGPGGAITQTGAPFTVSAGAGNYRMRIMCRTGSDPTNPCTTGGGENGEAKDFKITVIASSSPMTYSSSTTTQNTATVPPNSNNAQIIGLQVVTAGALSPIALSSLTINTNGSTNITSDATNARVFYTGTSGAFATGTQFGSTIANPNGSYTLIGSQTLSPGTNYFWVAYDVPVTATIGDNLDAECTSIIVNGITYTPVPAAPSGVRPISMTYCTPSAGATGCSLGGDSWITTVSLNGTGSTFNFTGGTCLTPFPNNYQINPYTGDVSQGGSYTATMIKGGSSSGARFIAWIDFNNNGAFTDAGEMVMDVTQTAASATGASFTVPVIAPAGAHRMRTWIGYTGTIVASDITSVTTGCEVLNGFSNQGEVRDFTVNVVSGCSAPLFTTCPGNISLNTAPGLCSAVGTYTTAVSGTTPVVTYAFTGATTGSGSGDGSGSAFNAGTTVVTATATNGCGTAPCTFNVVVTDNQNPVPVIASLPDITGECSASATAPAATDNCAGTVTATTIDPTSYNTQGSFVIHWTYDDGNGNIVTQNQNVIIDDVTNPTINNCPGNISSCNPVVSWTAPTASDNCGTASLSSNFNPGATFPMGPTTVIYTADDGNGNTATCSFTVTVIANPTVVISNNSSICLGQPATVHLVFTGTGPWNYTISDGSQTVSGTAATSPVNINITPVSTGVHNYTVTVLSDVNCPGTGSGTATVTVSSTLPANSIGTVNGPGEACSGSIVLISTNIVSGQNITYSWNTGSYSSVVKYSISAGGPFVTGPFITTIPSVYVEFGALAGSSGYNICVQAVNGCGSTNNKCSWVRGVVSVPGNISGSVVACQNDVKNYSCGLSNGASLYTWTLSGSSGPVTSGQGSANVSVTFPPAFTSGQLCVTAALACGGSSTSAPRCITVSNTPAIPGSMTGPSKVCPGATGVSFSIPAVTGATGYNWTVPAGATITSGANTTAITVNFPASYTGAPPVCVYALSSCSSSAGRCKTVGTNLPGQPGSITGPTTGICNSTVQYSINSVTLATSYTWTIPAGSTNFLGQGSTSIQFTVPPSPFASGQVTVVANTTACIPGTSTPRTITINGAPGLPGVISAFPSAWCDGGFVNFSITPASPLPVYQWIVTNGTIDAGQNTTNIDVTWGIGAGIVKVRATNSCGASGYRTLNTSSVCRELSRVTQEDHLSVYPNPAHDKVTVEMNNSIDEKAEINITDFTGKLIFTEQMQISMGITAIEIDLAHFAKGAYMISIMKASGVKRQGIMIQ